MALQIRRETALNLTLEGTVGSFRVGSRSEGHGSLEVKYFLTHVGLNFASSSNDQLLSNLAPVREIFDFASLDFDEIMQRDIDDARVSAELVPYLLDEHSRDTIKLFPPIVIVAMPIQESRNQPDARYPAVITETLASGTIADHEVRVIRSGAVGAEVFQFEQPVLDGVALAHDMARLRLNTHRTKLVIVDGQHRAMALLAIYRNLKDQWSDERRAPFREYYTAWTKSYIEQFNLTEINLPVIVCTIPELDLNYTGDFDMKKAARSIFLTLNKTARKVSESRNKLLDDNDIIAYFLRRTLTEVKRKDDRSPYALRIHNVELDQFSDRQKLKTPIAITGVNHIHYMIEHMMLDSGGSVQGVRPRAGRFDNRTKLHDVIDRLDGRDLLGSEAADAMRRYSFTSAAAATLGTQFDARYGAFIIGAFERFSPYDRHNHAVLELRAQIERDHDRQLKPILFDGQGIGRVFETYLSDLKKKLREGFFRTDVPEIDASAARLDATSTRIHDTIERFHRDRAARLLSDVPPKDLREGLSDAGPHPKILDWAHNLFENVFSSEAFQIALICGFLGLAEQAERNSEAGTTSVLDRAQAFAEYLDQLNQFFVPRSRPQLLRLVKLFTGEVPDGAHVWEARPSNQTFRNVVYRGEMQPDYWPKYRYMLLEIWKPTDPALKAVVEVERARCRNQVFSALHEFYRAEWLRENRVFDADLLPPDRQAIFDRAFEAYSALVRNLNAPALNRTAMKEALSTEASTAAAGPEDPAETDTEGLAAVTVEPMVVLIEEG